MWEWIILIVILFALVLYRYRDHFIVKYPPKYVHTELYVLMAKLEKILKRENIKYIISCGTLLGAVREGEIIDWDDDIDLVIFEDEDKLEKLKEPLKKLGYEMEKKDGIWRFDQYPDLYPYVDIFVGTVIDGKLVYKDEKQRNFYKHEYYYLDEIFPLKKYRLGPLILDGPRDPYPYLSRAYGDWKTPRYAKAHGSDKW